MYMYICICICIYNVCVYIYSCKIDIEDQGQRGPPLTRSGQLDHARDWEMLVDVGQQIQVASNIVPTSLRPDVVLWSNTLRVVHFVTIDRTLGG